MSIYTQGGRKRSIIFLFIVLAALLPFLLQIVRPFFTAFILASILAIVLRSVKERLHRRLGRPKLATFLITFTAVAVLGVILIFAGFTITRELEKLYDEFSRDSLEEEDWPALAATAVDHVANRLSAHFPINEEAVRTSLLNGMKTSSHYLLSQAGTAVSGVATFFFNGALMTVFLHFFLLYGKIWIRKLAALTPLAPEVAADIIKTIRDSVTANVKGMLVVLAGQGTLLIFGFWFAGVRSPILWGTIGGFVSVVPVIGSLLIWVPVAVGFLFMGAYGKTLFLAAWGIIVVAPADSILRAFVVGKQGKQHPILVALAAIGGAYAFGIIGVMLGPLIIALAAALAKEIQRLSINSTETEAAAVSPRTVEKTSRRSKDVLRLLLGRRKSGAGAASVRKTGNH